MSFSIIVSSANPEDVVTYCSLDHRLSVRINLPLSIDNKFYLQEVGKRKLVRFSIKYVVTKRFSTLTGYLVE